MGFDAAVECRTLSGAIGLQLRGSARARAAQGGQDGQDGQPGSTPADALTEVLFAGTAGLLAAPPAQLHGARVLQTSPHGYRIEAREGQFPLQARSVQLHREIAAAFFAAVPAPVVPRATRLGWAVLLGALRLPGLARLLGARGRRP